MTPSPAVTLRPRQEQAERKVNYNPKVTEIPRSGGEAGADGGEIRKGERSEQRPADRRSEDSRPAGGRRSESPTRRGKGHKGKKGKGKGWQKGWIPRPNRMKEAK